MRRALASVLALVLACPPSFAAKARPGAPGGQGSAPVSTLAPFTLIVTPGAAPLTEGLPASLAETPAAAVPEAVLPAAAEGVRQPDAVVAAAEAAGQPVVVESALGGSSGLVSPIPVQERGKKKKNARPEGASDGKKKAGPKADLKMLAKEVDGSGDIFDRFYAGRARTGAEPVAAGVAPVSAPPLLKRADAVLDPERPSLPPAAPREPGRSRNWLSASSWLGLAVAPWLALLPDFAGGPGPAIMWTGAALGAMLGREAAAELPRSSALSPGQRAAAAGLLVGALGVLALLSVGVVAAASPYAGAVLVSALALWLGWQTGSLESAWRAMTRKGPPPMMRTVRRGGRIFFDLGPEDMGRLRLFSAHVEKGLGEKDFYSSRMWEMSRLWYLRRTGEHVELVFKNDSFRAPPGSAQEKALAHSVPDAVMARARVARRGLVSNRMLVPVEELFGGDLLNLGDELAQSYGAPYELEADPARVESVRVFPRNVELRSRHNFIRKGPDGEAASLVHDRRRLPFTMRYSLLELPEPGFVPRRADERVGHFVETYEDWADDQSPRLERHLVQRWRLEKRDPSAAASPVKKPITFWIDPSIPPEHRAAVRRGILGWNEAFARVGLLGAIEVKDASEDPAYDLEDARYNAVHAYHLADSGFAIGPSHSNPLTGEIYHARVSFHIGHPRTPLDLDERDLDLLSDIDERPARAGRPRAGPARRDPGHGRPGHRCSAGRGMAQEAAAALSLLELRGVEGEAARRRVVEEYVTDLMLHEIGHTLGLRHNFRAGRWRTAEELGTDVLPTASVMDYAPINIAPPGRPQGRMMMTGPGPYDLWAIEYAYAPLDGLSPGQADEALARIAARAGQPGLDYATDEDADWMDPYAQTWTLGADPLEYARGRAALARELWDRLEAARFEDGADHERLQRAFIHGWAVYYRAMRAAMRFVGGMSAHRARAGDAAGRTPVEPVPAARQREALALLDKALFSDAPFAFSPELLRRLGSRPMPTVRDPDGGVSWVPQNQLLLWLRWSILRHLLDETTLSRLIESARFAGPKDKVLSLRGLLQALTRSICAEIFAPKPEKGRKTISVMRRQLQDEYLTFLIELGMREDNAEAEVPEVSSAVRAHLKYMINQLGKAQRESGWEQDSKDHLGQMIYRLEDAFDEDG